MARPDKHPASNEKASALAIIPCHNAITEQSDSKIAAPTASHDDKSIDWFDWMIKIMQT